MALTDNPARDRIRELNDALRKDFDSNLGGIVLTSGVAGLPSDTQAIAIRKTATFDAFNGDNDPCGEHDFGELEVDGNRFFWKIDYYDPTMRFGSEDPADATKTRRVLTLMLAEEY